MSFTLRKLPHLWGMILATFMTDFFSYHEGRFGHVVIHGYFLDRVARSLIFGQKSTFCTYHEDSFAALLSFGSG